jgi:hypothetical protein
MHFINLHVIKVKNYICLQKPSLSSRNDAKNSTKLSNCIVEIAQWDLLHVEQHLPVGWLRGDHPNPECIPCAKCPVHLGTAILVNPDARGHRCHMPYTICQLPCLYPTEERDLQGIASSLSWVKSLRFASQKTSIPTFSMKGTINLLPLHNRLTFTKKNIHVLSVLLVSIITCGSRCWF